MKPLTDARNFGSLQVESSVVARGNRLLAAGGRRFRLSTRVVKGLDSDGIPGCQLRAPLVLLERHEVLSLSHRERGFGICERDPVTLLIDEEQDVALVHELIVLHPHIIDITGDIWSDWHHIGSDTGISCPGRVEIVVGHVIAEKTSYSEEDKRKQYTYDRPHRLLLSARSRSSRSHKRNK